MDNAGKNVNGGVSVRDAVLSDTDGIFALIDSNRDLLAPRSVGNITESIDRFAVAELAGEIVGCASYQIHPEIGASAAAATVELVSIAVRKDLRKSGIGRMLVEAVLARVAAFGPREAIVLTFSPGFFAKFGFREIPKVNLMHKLYTCCINCTKHSNPLTCPEIAMTCDMPRKGL